jgi:hypothetical protein
MIKESKEVKLIVCTDKYAGNFERSATAYITGVVGDCDVGSDEAQDVYEDTLDIAEFVRQKIDDNGIWRPTSITDFFQDKYESFEIYLEPEVLDHPDIITKLKNRAYEVSEKTLSRGTVGKVLNVFIVVDTITVKTDITEIL